MPGCPDAGILLIPLFDKGFQLLLGFDDSDLLVDGLESCGDGLTVFTTDKSQ
jgi:hypothetical protein